MTVLLVLNKCQNVLERWYVETNFVFKEYSNSRFEQCNCILVLLYVHCWRILINYLETLLHLMLCVKIIMRFTCQLGIGFIHGNYILNWM